MRSPIYVWFGSRRASDPDRPDHDGGSLLHLFDLAHALVLNESGLAHFAAPTRTHR